MLARLLHRIARAGQVALHALRRRRLAATRPAAPAVLAGALADLARSKGQVVRDAAAQPPGAGAT